MPPMLIDGLGITLNLKGLAYDQAPVNLVKGEQRSEAFLARNPQGLVPALVTDDGTALTQSLAICEYLEECHPTPALLPEAPAERARVRTLAQIVASEIHPLNNLRVLKYLVGELKLDDDAKLAWYRHWVTTGFDALEAMLTREAGSATRRWLSYNKLANIVRLAIVRLTTAGASSQGVAPVSYYSNRSPWC